MVEAAERGATWYLAQMNRLFRIDARARRVLSSVAADPRRTMVRDRVAQWRERFSMPVLQTLLGRAATELVTLPPRTALATALGYLLGQRAPLTRCVTTPGSSL